MKVMQKFLTIRKMAPLMGDGGDDGTGQGAGDGGSTGANGGNDAGGAGDDGGSGSVDDGGDGGNAGAGAGASKYNDWRDSIPVDLAAEPTMQKFKDVSGLAKSYLELQKMTNQHSIRIPKKDATPEDWKGLYHKLGLPKDLAQYDIGQIENMDPTQVSALKAAAFEAGILPSQAAALIKAQGGMAFEAQSAAKNETTQFEQDNKRILEQDWGTNYNQNMQEAKNAVKYFGGEEALNAFLATPLANNAHVIKMFKSIANTVSEDVIGGDIGSVTGRESSMARVDAITNDPGWFDVSAQNHNALVNEHELLMRKIYPD